MDALAANWHARLADLKKRFPQPECALAVSFFHMSVMGIKETRFLEYLNRLLEGQGMGFEVDNCVFPLAENQDDYNGVKFIRDLSGLTDEITDYQQTTVPFDTFLDMLRACAQCHLRQFPENEALLLHCFHEHNLALSSDGADFPNQDDSETWWRKCDQKRNLRRYLRNLTEFNDPIRSAIDDFFAYLPEHLMLDFLRAATQRRSYETFFGNSPEDLSKQKATFFRGVLLEFSLKDKVQFIQTEHTTQEKTIQRDRVTCSQQAFDTLLHSVASAYAERRRNTPMKFLI